MWGRLSILCALTCTVISAPLTPTPLCPESCQCVPLNSGHLEIRCTSLDFLEKLQPKQVNAIVSLDLNNQNLTHIHSKIKKLRNLNTVNLSHNNIYDATELNSLPKLTNLNLKSNHIKYFTASRLLKQLRHLDLSHNYLTYIPQDLHLLPALREVNIAENPISCSCDVLRERDFFLKAAIVLVKPVSCHSPEKLRGQSLQTVTCTKYNDDLLDHMQGDEPIEGSGDEPTIENTEVFDDNTDHNNFTGIEEEGLIPDTPKTTTITVENEVEGSGFSTPEEEVEEEYEDEGSGDDELFTSTAATIYNRPNGCNFDCTNLTLDSKEESYNTTSEPDPDLFNEIGKAVQVFFPTESTVAPSTTTSTTTIQTIVEEEVVEQVDTENLDSAIFISKGENEKVVNEIKEPNKSSMNTNVIIVVVLLMLMLCLVGFSIYKKRRARNKRPELSEQELKPLNAKPSNGGGNIPEKMPLMNGQNGNMNGKPVEEPVALRRNEELPDEVDLRKKNNDEESLLPETHRVTIQVKELSTPKTPLLVNRLRSEDGQIITTPSTDQQH